MPQYTFVKNNDIIITVDCELQSNKGCSKILVSNNNLSTGEIFPLLNIEGGTIQDIAYWKDDDYLAVSSEKPSQNCNSAYISIWDIQSNNIVQEFCASEVAEVKSLNFLSNDKILIQSADNTIRVWNMLSSELSYFLNTDQNIELRDRIYLNKDKTLAASYEFTDEYGTTILVWDLNSESLAMKKIYGVLGGGSDIVFSPDNQYIIYADGRLANSVVMVRNIWNDDASFAISYGTGDRAVSYQISEDGKWLVLSDEGQQTFIWDMEKKKLSPPLWNAGRIMKIINNNTLLFINKNNAFSVWSSNSERVNFTLLDAVNEYSYKEGNLVICGELRQSGSCINIKTEEQMNDPSSEKQSPALVLTLVRNFGVSPEDAHYRFNSDNSVLAVSLPQSKLVTLWDMKQDEEIIRFNMSYVDFVEQFAFSENSDTLVAIVGLLGPGPLWLLGWDLSIQSWMVQACSIANRDLTQEEWHQYIGEKYEYKSVCSDVLANYEINKISPFEDIVP
jgi:WD40 repeat protein